MENVAFAVTERGAEEGLISAGRRRINLLWEATQAIMALSVTSAVIWNSVHGVESAMLNNAFFLIVGFYFSRTNHTKVGGVSSHDAGR